MEFGSTVMNDEPGRMWEVVDIRYNSGIGAERLTNPRSLFFIIAGIYEVCMDFQQ
jgi:hypothetical protein